MTSTQDDPVHDHGDDPAHDHGQEHDNQHDDNHHDHGQDHDHDQGDVEPVTDRTHDASWSANLELPQYAADADLVVDHALDAIEHTRPGHHVNLVTHGDHGHPSTYLYDELTEALDTEDVSWEYVEQCGCGGHVTRVHVG